MLWSEVDNFIPSGLDSARSNEASAAESLSSSQATTKRNALPFVFPPSSFIREPVGGHHERWDVRPPSMFEGIPH